MRRRKSLTVCILLCALALSGWSGVLAAALCPHGMKSAVMIATPPVKEEHAACHAGNGEATARHASSTHQSMDGMAEATTTQTKEESRTLAAPSQSSCWQCCMGHSNLPSAPFNPRESQPNAREVNSAPAEDVKPFAPPVAGFVPSVLPVQGAPPGQLLARHLLLNIFII
jgi:hypothetical protein